MINNSRKVATLLAMAGNLGKFAAEYTGLPLDGEQAAWNAQIDPSELQFYMQGVQRADMFRQNNFYRLFSSEELPLDNGNHTDGFQLPQLGDLNTT